MKSIALIFSLFTVSSAFAVSYECSNTQGQKLKIFQEKPDQATAVLQKGFSNKVFKGTFVYEDEALYEVTKYELSSQNGTPALITLTKKINFGRGGCGRGSCDSTVFKSQTALLNLNGESITFNCL